MECLVIHVPGVATNPALRKLDEFRFKAKKTGTGLGYTQITFSVKANTGAVVPKLKIVSGTGALSLKQGVDEVQELTVPNDTASALLFTAYIKCETDCVIGIENCKSVTQLGNFSPLYQFWNRLTTDNSPVLVLDLYDLSLFKACTNLLISSGQEASITGDISVFSGFNASRITIAGSATYPIDITGDISSFDKSGMLELRFNYTKIYGILPANLSGLARLDCRGSSIGGSINSLGAQLGYIDHSVLGYSSSTAFSFDLSSVSPKPNYAFLYDTIGGAFSGEVSDLIVPEKTGTVNIAIQSVGSTVTMDIYEVIRRISNKTVTNFTANMSGGETYAFSGSIGDINNVSGIGMLNITAKNIPDENAIAILDYINRSRVNAGLSKNISLRCNITNTNISTLANQLQAKGYTVNIYPLI